MDMFGDCIVHGHSRWRVRVYPEALSHKLLSSMEVRVESECPTQEEIITLEGVTGPYSRKVRKEPCSKVQTAIEYSDTYEVSFKANTSSGRRTHSVESEDEIKGESTIRSGITQAIDQENDCSEKLGVIPKVKAYQIQNEKTLFVEQAQAKTYDQVYCWNADGVLMCLSDDPDGAVKPKTQKDQGKKNKRLDPQWERLSALRLDLEDESGEGGLLAGETIAAGTVIWEFYSKLPPESDAESNGEEIPEVIIEYPPESPSTPKESNGNEEESNAVKILYGRSGHNLTTGKRDIVEIASDRNNNSDSSATVIYDGKARHDSEQSNYSTQSDDEYKLGKHFKWEPILGVKKPYLKSMLKEPLQNGVLLHTLTSSYRSQCLDNTYIVLNNDLRFLRYDIDGNVTVQQSEITHEGGTMAIDQIVAIKEINIGEEVLRDFKTIVEELHSGFMPFSP